MQLEGTTTTQSVRASTFAGAAIVVVAGVALAALALRDRVTFARFNAPAPTATRAASAPMPPTSAVLLTQALTTSNVYARPARTAEVVAVLPGGQRAAVTGRSQDAQWLHVTTPPASGIRGWLPVAAVRVEAEMLTALPIIDPAAVIGPTRTAGPADALPDPALTEAFVLSGGQLAVGIENLGPGALLDATLALSVTQLGSEADGGSVIGVFRIGPATLPAGGRVTIVVPLTVTAAGSYRLELNPDREAPDVRHSNNVIEVSLQPGRS